VLPHSGNMLAQAGSGGDSSINADERCTLMAFYFAVRWVLLYLLGPDVDKLCVEGRALEDLL